MPLYFSHRNLPEWGPIPPEKRAKLWKMFVRTEDVAVWMREAIWFICIVIFIKIEDENEWAWAIVALCGLGLMALRQFLLLNFARRRLSLFLSPVKTEDVISRYQSGKND